MTPDTLAHQGRKLLPPGLAWLAPVGSRMYALLLAVGDELSRVYGRVTDVLAEAYPSTTSELLSEWETEYDSPGGCVTATLTTAERRAALRARYVAVGGASPAYFVAVAAALGVPIQIDSVGDPFIAGVSYAGVGIVGGSNNRFEWRVLAPAGTASNLRQALECQFGQIKPAHTTVIFSYTL